MKRSIQTFAISTIFSLRIAAAFHRWSRQNRPFAGPAILPVSVSLVVLVDAVLFTTDSKQL